MSRQESLPSEDISVPLCELPDPEGDNGGGAGTGAGGGGAGGGGGGGGGSGESLREQEGRWGDLALHRMAADSRS